MAYYCDRCGNEHKENAKFCSECGKTLNYQDIPTELKALSKNMTLASRYEIIERIKSGGMGAVYKANDLRLGKICAIKELLHQSIDEEEQENAIKMFEREAKILSSLQHPNLPAVTDYFAVGNRYYLAMKFIEGKDLSAILRQAGEPGLPEDKVVEWAMQICDVLIYLHSRNPPVIYRDLKPSNIMIRKSDGKVVLIDFGIARVLEEEEAEEASTKTAIGTVGYMSPEQYRGWPEPRSDVYSLGATMYHLLRGKPPIPFTFESIKKARPDVSDEINAVVMNAVRLKPADRFDSALDMKKALAGMITVAMPVTEELDETDLLILQLKSSDKTLRIYATKTLGELKTVKAVPALIKVLREEKEWTVRRSALESLIVFGNKDRVLSAINKSLLEDERDEVRAAAAIVMAKIKDKTFIDALLDALKDPSADVRWRAIIALGELKAKRALNPLYELIDDKAETIREEAISAIEKIDPNFLKLWKEGKEKVQKKFETKKMAFIGTSIVVLLVIALVLVKVILSSYHKQQADNYFDLGIKHINSKEVLKAREQFLSMLEISSNDARAYYGLGLTYLSEDIGKAEENLIMATRLDANYGDPYFALRNIHAKREEFDRIIPYMKKAVELDPNNPYGYFFLAQAYYKEGNNEKAKEIFEICALQFPEEEVGIKSKQLLGKMGLESSDYYSDAEEKKLIKQGEAAIQKGEFNEGLNYFTKALAINPSNYKAYYGLGMCYYDTDRETAKNNFSEALKLNPDYSKTSYALACLAFEEDDFTGTIKYSELSLEKNPAHHYLYVILGISYYNTGDEDLALKAFNSYLTLAPAGEQAENVKNMINEINSK